MEITLREAMPNDASAILALIETLNEETSFVLINSHAINMATETMAGEIAAISEMKNQLLLLATTKQSIVGLATVTTDTDPAVAHVGEIGLSILKEYWGLGLGTTMLEEVILWSKHSTDLIRLDIKVQSHNERAIALYNKVGFSYEGTLRKAVLTKDNTLVDVDMMGYLLDNNLAPKKRS